MNTYHLLIIGGHTSWREEVKADSFTTTTNNSTSKGYYAFHANGELVACYPIDRTSITSIERP
jgi:hypothetical protein